MSARTCSDGRKYDASGPQLVIGIVQRVKERCAQQSCASVLVFVKSPHGSHSVYHVITSQTTLTTCWCDLADLISILTKPTNHYKVPLLHIFHNRVFVCMSDKWRTRSGPFLVIYLEHSSWNPRPAAIFIAAATLPTHRENHGISFFSYLFTMISMIWVVYLHVWLAPVWEGTKYTWVKIYRCGAAFRWMHSPRRLLSMLQCLLSLHWHGRHLVKWRHTACRVLWQVLSTHQHVMTHQTWRQLKHKQTAIEARVIMQ